VTNDRRMLWAMICMLLVAFLVAVAYGQTTSPTGYIIETTFDVDRTFRIDNPDVYPVQWRISVSMKISDGWGTESVATTDYRGTVGPMCQTSVTIRMPIDAKPDLSVVWLQPPQPSTRPADLGEFPQWMRADMDFDGDVDLADMMVFDACFNGPNKPPACQ
jgi:hypothetical protein